MIRTITKVLVKSMTHSFGIITILSLIHFFMIEYIGMSPWIVSNVWGCACIFVFMDSIILANDLKIMENKYQEIEIRYKILEAYHAGEKQAFLEREKRMLNSLCKQASQQMSKLDSMNTSISRVSQWMNDVQLSNENTPEMKYTSSKSEVPHIEKSVLDSSDTPRNNFFRTVRKQCSMSMPIRRLAFKKRLGGLTECWSEIIVRSSTQI